MNLFSNNNNYRMPNFGFNSGSGSGSGYGSGSGSGSGYGSTFSKGLSSDDIVSKIAFLLAVIIIFIILTQASISFVAYLFSPTQSPHLIDGMVDAKQMMTIAQSPSVTGAKTIYRSVNQKDGLEFTWSTWLYINNLGPANGKYQHIFNKGNDTADPNGTGLNYPNNAPGMYISPNTNELTVIFNTYDVINEEITIPDIPLNKWFNVILRCRNKTVDIYVNGTITKSMELIGVPKQNYGDVYVAMNGGFDGYISNLWYYNYSLNTLQIDNIMKKGPNTKMVSSGSGSSMNLKNNDYLSLRWYFAGSGDEFNPVDRTSYSVSTSPSS